MPTPPRLPANLKVLGKSKTLSTVSDRALETVDERAETLSSRHGEDDLSTIDALQEMGASRVDSRMGILRSQLFFMLFSRLPYPVIMVLPFIHKDGKLLIRQLQWRRGRQKLTDEATETDTSTSEAVDRQRQTLIQKEPSPYLRYRCPDHPLTCSQLDQTQPAGDAVNHCQQCGFPGLLPENAEIRGQQGRYRVGRFLGSRGLGRLYTGQDVNRQQPVVIREYLLPVQHFNAAEQHLTRNTFETIAGLKLADGREQDFRLMEPWDVIGDRNDPERCYLITKGAVDTFPTLRSVLVQQGALKPSQVRQILNQVLQTLESLHGQTYVLPAGQIQKGLVHGNLNLDSIVILPDADSYYEQPQLLAFVRDLALWESLFIPPPAPAQISQAKDDRVALGQIGLSLLVGHWNDEYGRPLKPRSAQVWPGKDLPLEQFLRQLLDIEAPTFASATEARQALLQLPPLPTTPLTSLQAVAPAEPTRTRRLPLWVWLILLAGLVGVIGAGLLGWWLSRRRAIASQPPSVCCIAEVAAVPPGQFNYAAARQGIWYPLWHSKNLVVQGKTLEQVLEAEQSDLNLQLTPVASSQVAIDQVGQDGVDFAIAPLPNNRPTDVTIEPIAYDGLAVFVAFSYVEREQGLPHHLQGQISLTQLRQLYTGEITNWQALGGPNLPVKLYLPNQPELIEIFEARVLQTPEAIQTFRRLWGLEMGQTSRRADSFISRPEIESTDGEMLPTLEMLTQTLEDFEAEAQIGSIGFASLSQVYGQCSVYPLAIAADDDDDAVQPLYQQDGTPISPAADLCGDKGNYGPAQSLFANQTYPLAYPLAVLYRPDNSRLPIGPIFVQMMTTDEGQQILGKTGLVPLVGQQNQVE
ncbi:MAG: substrate-binding domain-containing protein [Cyanobacteria bacterium J06639_16]